MKYSPLVASIISFLLGTIHLLFVREGMLVVVSVLLITLSGGFAIVLGSRAWKRGEAEGLIAVILANGGLWEMAAWLFWWFSAYEYVR